MNTIRVAVTGAAGQVAYAMLGRLAGGEIFGAGQVRIWDRGTYDTEKWQMDGPKKEVIVNLHGQRLHGRGSGGTIAVQCH